MSIVSFDAVVALAGRQASEDIFTSLLLSQATLIVAADGGADCVIRLGYVPNLVVGDFDSIEGGRKRLLHESTKKMVFSADKSHTDGELALAVAVLRSLGKKIPEEEFALYAEFKACGDLTGMSLLFLNCFGSRQDHTLANIALAVLAARRGANVFMTDGMTLGRVIVGPRTLIPVFHRDYFVRAGSRRFLFSAQPLDDRVSGLTIKGLRWELVDVSLPLTRALALSNYAHTNHPDNVRIDCRQGTLALFTFPETL
ncbi:MAG TPA: thiamine diphosphokinase [Clostridiaceae bacterium]|nr:thiamine diphosphokinase [Clostridiaceae bacterium]